MVEVVVLEYYNDVLMMEKEENRNYSINDMEML
jgi:hypothetical protein